MKRLTFIYLALLLSACGDSVTNPQPVPIPGVPDRSLIFLSGRTEQDDPVAAGLPGAVKDVEDTAIVIHSVSRDLTFRAPVHQDGSFVVKGPWDDDTLMAWVQRGDQESERVVLTLITTKFRGVLIIQSISAATDGLSTVTGTGDTGTTVVVGNLSQSAAASVKVSAENIFSTEIIASPGDRLALFTVDSQGGTSSPVEAEVPAN